MAVHLCFGIACSFDTIGSMSSEDADMPRNLWDAAARALRRFAGGSARSMFALIALILIIGVACGCSRTRVVNWKPRHALGMTGPTTRAAAVTGDVTLEDVLDETYNAGKKVWVAIPAGPDGQSIVWVPMN
jgi:hypothetical protein